MGTGWYMCKIETIDGRIRVVTPCCACEVVDSSDPPAARAGIIVNKMRWCKGTPVEDRCAAISGHLYNAYYVKPSVIKQEPADHDRPPGAVATLPRPRVRPYASTDIEAAGWHQRAERAVEGIEAAVSDIEAAVSRPLFRPYAATDIEHHIVEATSPSSSHAGPIQADLLSRDLDRIFGPRLVQRSQPVERRNYMRLPLPLSAQARERLSGYPP